MKTTRRMIAMLLAVVTLVGMLANAPAASAATSSALATKIKSLCPIICYAMPTSGASRVYAYSDASLSTKQTAYYVDSFSEQIVITDISDSGQSVKIRYLSGSGAARDKWFRTDDVIGLAAVSIADFRANAAMTVYRMSASNSVTKYGSVSGGSDTCYKLGSHNVGGTAYNTVIYMLSSASTVNGITAKHKMGLVAQSIYDSSANQISDMEDVTRSFAGKQVKIRSVQNGRYLCADSNQNNTPAMCNKDNALTWETFTVTVTSDGWAGFKAHNGKWLSALSNVTDTPVRAVGENLYAWECFRIYKKGSDYYIKAQVNSRYLCVRVDLSGAPVQSYASVASTWERFQIEIVTNNSSNNSFTHPMKNYHKNYTQWGVKPSYRNGSALQYHAGVDYMSNKDSGVYAFTSGTVAETGYNKANGYYIYLKHTISGITVYSFYAHLNKISVTSGQTVSTGEQIGTVGQSGSSANGTTHLHFAVVDYLYSGGGLWGYVTKFTGEKVKFTDQYKRTMTFYNPYYIVANGKLP